MNILPEREEFRWKIRKVKKQVVNFCTRYAFVGSIALGLMASTSPVALANPEGGNVVEGSATITDTGSELQINQTTDKALIEWSSFDIDQGETTRFIQPGTDSLALNRVVNSTQISTINGNLFANGQVIVINPNGVLIGSSGNIDTAGFIATSADIDNDAFMQSTGALNFDKAGDADAVVENQGTITVGEAGLAGFVAPVVRNNGVIQGRLAKVQLAAADTFAVDFYGDGLLHLAVAGSEEQARELEVENNGSIIVDGGQVILTAADASDVVNTAINNTGVIEAKSLIESNGEIILTAAGADVSVSGTLDVSGEGDGGSIKIGGDFQGGGDLAWADTVDVKEEAYLSADAGENGNGGEIIVWSETATVTRGTYSARGGSVSGDGGLVETSSKGDLDYAGTYVDTLATDGDIGLWLLDPQDVTVDAAEAATIGASGSNVLVEADEDIDIAADITMINAVDLAFLAGNTIGMGNNTIIMAGGDLSMTVAFSDTFTTTGNISINNSTILTNGGNFTVDAYNDLTMNGNGGDPLIVITDGGTISLTAGGDFSTTTGRYGTGGGDFIVYGENSVTFQSTTVNTTGGTDPGSISVSDDDDDNITLAEFGNKQNHWSQGEGGGNIIITSSDVKTSNNNCFKAGGSDATCAENVPDPTDPPTTEPPTTEPPTTEPPTTEPPTTEPPTTEPPTTEPPTTEPPTTEPPTTEPPTTEPPTTEPPTTEPPQTTEPPTEPPETEPPTTPAPTEETTAPFIEIDPLGRPIISFANQAIVLDEPFEPIEIETVGTDVNIRVGATPGTQNAAEVLAGIAPAAGEEEGETTPEEAAEIEPAAGGDEEPQAQDDIFCANAFLENEPCDPEDVQ